MDPGASPRLAQCVVGLRRHKSSSSYFTLGLRGWFALDGGSRFTSHEPTHERPNMKQRTMLKRAKLPPILEIDEYGLPVNERESFYRPRWSADGAIPTV